MWSSAPTIKFHYFSDGINIITPKQSTSLPAVSSPDSVVAKRVMANHSATLKQKLFLPQTYYTKIHLKRQIVLKANEKNEEKSSFFCYFTIKFTSLPLTMMHFFTDLPAIASATSGFAQTVAWISSSVKPSAIIIFALILLFT